MEAYVCNPSTEEAETRGWIQLQSQIGLLILKKQNNSNNNINNNK